MVLFLKRVDSATSSFFVKIGCEWNAHDSLLKETLWLPKNVILKIAVVADFICDLVQTSVYTCITQFAAGKNSQAVTTGEKFLLWFASRKIFLAVSCISRKYVALRCIKQLFSHWVACSELFSHWLAQRKKLLLVSAMRENSCLRLLPAEIFSLSASPLAQDDADSEKFSRTASTGELNFTVVVIRGLIQTNV